MNTDLQVLVYKILKRSGSTLAVKRKLKMDFSKI